MQNVSLNYVKDWLSCDIVRFKIEVGVDAKCTVKTRKMATTASNIACRGELLQPVSICSETHTAGIVCSVDIHATACYSKICRSVIIIIIIINKG